MVMEERLLRRLEQALRKFDRDLKRATLKLSVDSHGHVGSLPVELPIRGVKKPTEAEERGGELDRVHFALDQPRTFVCNAESLGRHDSPNQESAELTFPIHVASSPHGPATRNPRRTNSATRSPGTSTVAPPTSTRRPSTRQYLPACPAGGIIRTSAGAAAGCAFA